MVQRWYIMIAGFVISAFFIRRYLKTPAGKAKFQALVLKMPIIGGIIRKVAVARFARTFASLMGAGVNVLEALRVTGRAIGNSVYQAELDRAINEVKAGKQLSQALTGSDLFPAIIPQMLSVGEETGQTDTVLIKVADFYEEEVDATIDGLSSIIEPLMITFMGAMVGLIAYSVMGPISGLANQIKG
jgi:type IV pilus assembly protein PilC